MKEASKLMTEEKFWSIIENSHRGRDLKECLTQLSEDELFGFRYWWEYFCHMSYKQDLWAVAYIVLGGCGDDGFDYFRFWLIAQGRQVFYDALKNADTLCDVFSELEDPEGDDYPEQEELDYVVMTVLGERTGDEDYFYTADYELPKYEHEIVFEWNEDDEESLRKVCPRTFDKWWENDVF